MNRMEAEVNPGGYIDNHGQPVKESFWAKFKRPIAGLAAGVTIVTGAGAMAEKTTPTVDNPTKIEGEVDSSEASVKDEMPQLPEDDSSESTTSTTEGGITSKGVSDLLANANEGAVTSGDVGVEVPKSDGGEVQYASNITNENGEPIIVPLEGTGSGEVEKSQIELIADRAVGYLSEAPGYTDEEIKLELITTAHEKITDLGLLKFGSDVQGRFLGYLESNDKDNLLLFLGVKNRDEERFVTALRLPLYVIEDKGAPTTAGFVRLKSSSFENNAAEKYKLKDKVVITSLLDCLIGENIVAYLITDKSGSESSKIDTLNRYINEMMKVGIPYSRSLAYALFDNGIDLDYENSGKGCFSINDKNTNHITSILSGLVKDNAKITTLPATPTIKYFRTNSG